MSQKVCRLCVMHYFFFRIVKQEADHAQRESPERAEPRRTNGVTEPRPIDILELLSKAKEEYQRVRRQIHTFRCNHVTLVLLTQRSYVTKPQSPFFAFVFLN